MSHFNLHLILPPTTKIVYIGFSAAISSFIGWIAAMLGADLVGF